MEDDLQFTLQKKTPQQAKKTKILAYGALTPIQEIKNFEGNDNEKVSSYIKKKNGIKMADIRTNLIHKLNANKENLGINQNKSS